MDFRNISAWSIRNPVVPIILFIGLMMLGIVAFAQMKVQNMPDIEFPAAIVVVSQPGAAPTEIENQITQKVEAAVRTINGVDSISSTASEGSSQTMIMFQIGVDVNEALNEVKNAIDQARGDLPDGILEPQVFKAENSSDMAAWAVSADDMTVEQLSWFIDDSVAKRLLSIPGMAAVNRSGGVTREIRVTLDPGRMQSLGITASQVNAALRQLNTNAAGGRAEISGSRQSIRVLGNAATAYQLSQVQVAIGGGRTIKLTDFATVADSFKEVTSISKMNGKPVVSFDIQRARGASDVALFDDTVAELAKIEKEHPGVHFVMLYDFVKYTKQQYDSSISSIIEGAILAVIVVFFFLRDWRATLMSAIAIPLSAIPTFYFLFSWFGFTLNSLSLLALGLVSGVLVDDAIVEIENIVRHMRMGKSAYQAAIDAADEIGLAVVATTFSIVAVFLPVGMIGGVTGQFFKSFGLTVVTSVLLSLVVARMITPMVAAYFLESHGVAEHASGPWMDRYIRLLRWTLDNRKAKDKRAQIQPVQTKGFFGTGVAMMLLLRVVLAIVAAVAVANALALLKLTGALKLLSIILPIVALIAGYMLARALFKAVARMFGSGFAAYSVSVSARLRARLHDHRVWMIGVGFGALLMTLGLLATIPLQFFPPQDADFASVGIEMVPGTTIQQTEQVSDQAMAIILADPATESAYSSVREGNGRIFINLKQERDKTSQAYQQTLTEKLQTIPDARITFRDLQGGGGGGGSGRAISVMLSGSDPVALEKAATTLIEQMKAIPGVVAPRIAADMRRPEVIIRPRTDLATSLGVSTSAISQAIRIATIGDIDQNAAKFSLSDRQVPIRVRLSEDARRNLSTISNLPVPTSTGGSVPLSSVAEITLGSGPISIQRYNQSRRVIIGADVGPGFAQGTITTQINQLPIMQRLPDGISNAPVGSARFQGEMVKDFGKALAAGILLVFSVLVLLYHRFVSPLVNMGSLFLAPLGGLIVLGVVGQPLSLPVFIGILMLFGIVAKNSILLVDFAIDEMSKGTNKYDAIIEAGHKRAQPIVMTTVAMTAGMVPTALSIGSDGAWRAPMGIVVIGGLILSTMLTLVIVPAGFSLADGFEKRVGPALRKKFLTYKPEDGQRANYPAAVEDLPPKALAAE
ncbi:efflux RND transporter permease subunit [Novosphingobium sp.]|uniref:efflux RND transporter permease subunit n=1 Tax=Novosphingobium sp. TaxID=1874826 RepID=UPI00286E508B|nr:efflux RND transporter permease subunit [Novosphingobium sp.]